MKNIENAVLISSTPEPMNAALPDVLIYCLIADMMDTAWNTLQYGPASVKDMVLMKQQYANRCKDASRVLYLSGTGDDETWAIQPVFMNDYPVSDVSAPDELPVTLPVGVEYRGTVYSFDIEAYLAMPRPDYLPAVREMYAEKIAALKQGDASPADFIQWSDDDD